tara:strand:+ start:1257 stop:1625 length:369 start_codon:yes stop_codon:yes gene_type:complete
MKALKQENLEELKENVYKLISHTSIEIGHKTDGKTMAALATIFAQDLIQEKRFGNMSFNQIEDAFRLGVRFGKEEPFLNIRTFYRWSYAHKKVIDNAWYEVHTLGKPKKETLYYQEPLKLLK